MTMSKLSHAILTKTVLAFCFTCMIIASSYGKEREWWFEVEVILFKHDRDANMLSESFTEQNEHQIPRLKQQSQLVDLLDLYLKPDISVIIGALPNCSAPHEVSVASSFDFLKLDPILLDPDIAISDIRVDIVEPIEEPSATLLSAPNGLDKRLLNTHAVEAENEALEKTQYIVSFGAQETSELDALENLTESTDDIDSDANITDPVMENNIQEQSNGLIGADGIQMQEKEASLTPSFAYQFYDIHMADFDIKSIELPKQFNCVISKPMFEAAYLEKEQSPTAEIIEEVPMKINGTELLFQDTPYLLAEDSLALVELVTSLKRKRAVKPLLHMGWRQEVLFDEANSKPVRLFAGINYANDFNAHHMPLQAPIEEPYVNPYPVDLIIESYEDQESEHDENDQRFLAEDDLIQKIRNALADPDFTPEKPLVDDQDKKEQQITTDQLWQLDGNFKIFLKYIQGTPYLHIDSEFDFRAPVFNAELMTPQDSQQLNPAKNVITNNYLQNFHFKQLRRIISKQIHYFDHPLFGMIVQVRRHERPDPEEIFEDPQIEKEQ